jgi:ACR3 family arsenite transporter
MSKYLFSLVILISLAVGLFLPSVTLLWSDYLIPLLAMLMFFSALRVEKRELYKTNPKELIALLFFVFIIMPLLSLPFKLSQPLTFIGVLVALSSPSAAATAFFSSFLGGDTMLGVSISFVSSLLSIAALPLTLQLFAGAIIPIDQSKIFVILLEVILLPILIALLSKKLFRKAVDVVNNHRDYQLVVMFLVSSGTIGIGHGVIASNEYQFIELTAAMLAILLSGATLAYLFGRRYGNKAAITFFVGAGVKNATLAFAIMLELFGPLAVLPMVANLVAQFILMALFEIVGCKIL